MIAFVHTSNPTPIKTQAFFLDELNIFRNEVNSALKFLYTELAIHAIANKNKSVLKALNLSPTFWNTILNGLQHSTFITLGRIFDSDSSLHSIHTLFNFAQGNKQIFSKKSFIDRWQANMNKRDVDHWLPKYLETLYIPTDEDFRKFRKFIAQQKKNYENIYAPVRHHFGHKKYTKNEDIKILFDKIQVKELEKFCVRLTDIHEALWQLYHNGRGPLLPLRRQPYSTLSILKKKYPPHFSRPFNVQIIEEAINALNLLKIGAKYKSKLI